MSSKFMLLRCRKRVQQRLALYQGVCPIYMEFLDDAEATFSDALALLQVCSGIVDLISVSRFRVFCGYLLLSANYL